MPVTDPIQGATFLPAWNDAYQIPQSLADMYAFLLDRGIPRFSTTAERDAQYPAPSGGKLAFADGVLYIRSSSAWVKLWDGSGVAKREVRTGTGVLTIPNPGSIGSALATIDTGSDGTRTVSLLVTGVNVPYSSTTPSTSVWGTVNAALRPVDDASAQFTHPTNVGLGWIKSDGELAMRWGTFSTTGTTNIRCTANYPLPAL